MVRMRFELRFMKYSRKRLDGMMIGSFLIKIIWVMGAKGKEGFIFETNQCVLFSFLPEPHTTT